MQKRLEKEGSNILRREKRGKKYSLIKTSRAEVLIQIQGKAEVDEDYRIIEISFPRDPPVQQQQQVPSKDSEFESLLIQNNSLLQVIQVRLIHPPWFLQAQSNVFLSISCCEVMEE